MTRKPSPLPDFNVKVVQPGGDMHPDWYRFFANFRASLGEAIDVIDAPAPPDPEIDIDQQYPILIAFPANKDYVLIQNNDVERTITATVSDCTSGTCTATFKINSTPLGGTANSVSTTEQVRSHASANVLGVGDDLVVTISSATSCVDARLNVKTTRTITVS